MILAHISDVTLTEAELGRILHKMFTFEFATHPIEGVSIENVQIIRNPKLPVFTTEDLQEIADFGTLSEVAYTQEDKEELAAYDLCFKDMPEECCD